MAAPQCRYSVTINAICRCQGVEFPLIIFPATGRETQQIWHLLVSTACSGKLTLGASDTANGASKSTALAQTQCAPGFAKKWSRWQIL